MTSMQSELPVKKAARSFHLFLLPVDTALHTFREMPFEFRRLRINMHKYKPYLIETFD